MKRPIHINVSTTLILIRLLDRELPLLITSRTISTPATPWAIMRLVEQAQSRAELLSNCEGGSSAESEHTSDPIPYLC